MNSLFLSLLFLSLLSFSYSSCPNNCNNNGLCVNNVCQCFDGFKGGAPDCSYRNCPVGPAWADKASALDTAHANAECSNAGLCNRETGTCECFSGFTGAACQRNECPNKCSGRGNCILISDAALFLGPSNGVVYSNWDKNSIQMCECSDGYYGADCSLLMCPKGDDPLTINQNFRTIQIDLDVDTTNILNTHYITLVFQGKRVNIPLDSTSAECTTALSYHGKFGQVDCDVTETLILKTFKIAFHSWPLLPRENNLYSHNGNPLLSEFSCEYETTSLATGVILSDVIADNVIENVQCSNRGVCNTSTGICSCLKGFAGAACSETLNVYPVSKVEEPAHVISSTTADYISTLLKLSTVKGKSSDFRFIESFANSELIFSLSGDGYLKTKYIEAEKIILNNALLDIVSTAFNLEGNSFQIIESTYVLSPLLYVHQQTTSTITPSAIVDIQSDMVTAHDILVVRSGNNPILTVKSTSDVRIDGELYVDEDIQIEGVSLFEDDVTINADLTVNSISSGPIQITTGDLALDNGDITMTLGSVTLTDGDINLTDGDVTLTDGSINIQLGNLNIPTGNAVLTGGDVQLTNGNVELTNGDVTLDNGSINIQLGNLNIPTGNAVLTGGDVQLTNGNVELTNGDVTLDNGDITVAVGKLIVQTNNVEVPSGSVIVGTGNVEITTGNVDVDTGNVLINSGNLEITSGDVVISDGDLTLESGSYQLTIDSTGFNLVHTGASFPVATLTDTMARFLVAPDVYSDMRLKTNITVITDALEKIKSLRGVYYNWSQSFSSDRRTKIGFLAQEVKQKFPELVHQDEKEFYTVDYQSMTAVLAQGVKELDSKVTKLEKILDEKTEIAENLLSINKKFQEQENEMNNLKKSLEVLTKRLTILENENLSLKLELNNRR